MIANSMQLVFDAKAWLKRKRGPDEVIRVILDEGNDSPVTSYELFTAYDAAPEHLGRILFDAQGYWIYDGDILTIDEQEQLAKFIIHYANIL